MLIPCTCIDRARISALLFIHSSAVLQNWLNYLLALTETGISKQLRKRDCRYSMEGKTDDNQNTKNLPFQVK